MSRQTTEILKAALSALHRSGMARMARPFTSGDGVILMLHHVTPEPARAFDPNRSLKVTPEFLDTVIQEVRAQGFEIISLDDVPSRLKDRGDGDKPFAVFTLDDGYKDNRDFAYPVFKRHGVPFTIYVPSTYADGEGDLWWLMLETALQRLEAVTVALDGDERAYSLANDREKTAAFHDIYWSLRKMPERDARAVVNGLAAQAGIDGHALCRDLIMSWDEIRALARDPLVCIGAHTCNHMALAKLPDEEARQEMAESIARIERELGRPCRHFSYPYGDEGSAAEREFEIARELGVETAVTTRKGLLYAPHADALTALPRLSLNGHYQDVRYLSALLSGLPFALRDGVKSVLTPVKAGARKLSGRDAATRPASASTR
ncbi:polysaccharide deacetylase [Hyphomicrobium methylovorum]|uniref:polysaccharide deacetylase family protein n=1 Tax=Hyphomicrobium methylovorum TaxID=84 RepID=UPI0015E65A16|nr:polysaccharide deacetylase family protein [Hyphomicrobium methylovorum]MBA2127639.1 polysaccharide deacetylase [Hyphomicrobium methylovorum]